MGKVLPIDEKKSQMCSIRLTVEQEEFINRMISVIQEERGPGAKRVTKTEAILILVTMGIERFHDEHKKATIKRKKEVS